VTNVDACCTVDDALAVVHALKLQNAQVALADGQQLGAAAPQVGHSRRPFFSGLVVHSERYGIPSFVVFFFFRGKK
jgi:hypothetical protein